MTVQVVGRKHYSKENVDAILKFQSLWRGYRVRRNFISKPSYLAAKLFIAQCKNLADLPRACSGITKVYLPPHLPVVFKALGQKRSRRRFFTMCKARDLCIKNGYKHLWIPKARPCNEYNIEEKLAVHEVKQREQIALYEDNQEKFTLAIKEFTGFLYQSIFPDILTDIHPYQKETKIPLVRCDNLPLVLDGNRGKIVLIDLGGHEIRSQRPTLAESVECAKIAIFIFPYHFKEIFDAAVTFCPEIIQERQKLQDICNQTIARFKCIYRDHFAFLQEKMSAIGLDQPSAFQGEKKQDPLESAQVISLAVKKYSLVRDAEFLNPEICSLFIDKIILPIINQLTKKANAEGSPASIFLRSITLPCDHLFDFFKDEECLAKAQSFLQIILEEFMHRKDICYANQYSNRTQQRLIRMHY